MNASPSPTHRDDNAIEPFPVVQAASLQQERPENRWLIDGLWPAAAVGVIGGHPKSCKTWWGLELAVSLATGTPCLGTFTIKRPARALLYLAEDQAHAVRDRLHGLCAHRGHALEQADFHILTVDRLRLDSAIHLQRLDATITAIKPRLLLLDPLVRLHSKDENTASELTPILGNLRALQRKYDLAIALVHHARKNAAGKQYGRSLRGSGDIFAWADVLHYLNRTTQGIRLNIEHRSAPAPDPITLQLTGQPPHLIITSSITLAPPTLDERILKTLNHSDQPLRRAELRTLLAVNNKRLGDTLLTLENQGRIRRSPKGWHT